MTETKRALQALQNARQTVKLQSPEQQEQVIVLSPFARRVVSKLLQERFTPRSLSKLRYARPNITETLPHSEDMNHAWGEVSVESAAAALVELCWQAWADAFIRAMDECQSASDSAASENLYCR